MNCAVKVLTGIFFDVLGCFYFPIANLASMSISIGLWGRKPQAIHGREGNWNAGWPNSIKLEYHAVAKASPAGRID
ncbi:hypothetical protein ASPTUDRAFT_47126, partial [Aspergillus tubingensis CBS 134.48]